MVTDDVVVEYRGQSYSLPVVLVGSARGKLTNEGLSERLEEAIDGQRATVVIDGDSEARSFYFAARSISVPLERDNLDWQRLLAELGAHSTTERSSRSQILAAAARGGSFGRADG